MQLRLTWLHDLQSGMDKSYDQVHLWGNTSDSAALLRSQGSEKTFGAVQLSCQYLTMENKDDLLDAAAYQASPACLPYLPACFIWLGLLKQLVLLDTAAHQTSTAKLDCGLACQVWLHELRHTQTSFL